MNEPRFEITRGPCHACNETGLDDAHWSGRCPLCDGSGESESDELVCEDCGYVDSRCQCGEEDPAS